MKYLDLQYRHIRYGQNVNIGLELSLVEACGSIHLFMFFSLILWSNPPSQTQLAPLNGWWGNEPLFVFLCGISGDDQWLKDVFNSAWIITTVCLVKSIGTVVDAVAGRYALTIDCAQRLTWAGCKTKTKTKTNTRCLWIKGRENFFFPLLWSLSLPPTYGLTGWTGCSGAEGPAPWATPPRSWPRWLT